MRLYFKTEKNTKPIPWDYQQLIVGNLHKWIGVDNEEHDGKPSLYSVSWLNGAVATKSGLEFPNGANFFFSAFSGELCERVITGARKTPKMFNGLKVEEIIIGNRPEFTQKQYFYTASPILVRKMTDNVLKHLSWNDPEANERLTEIIHTKMKMAGLSGDISIRFDKDFTKAKTKIVNYKNIQNKANICPVIIEGEPDLIRFAYNVGIGESTGATFGSIRI